MSREKIIDRYHQIVLSANVERNYSRVTKFNHDDYNEMKDDLGWTNADVAKVVGFEATSVKNQTQPKSDLPLWAQTLILMWYQEHEGQIGKHVVDADVAEYNKTLKNDLEAVKDELKSKDEVINALEQKLKRSESALKKTTELLDKLKSLENESMLDYSNVKNLTLLKSKVKSLNSKHTRKLKVLDKIEGVSLSYKKKSKKVKV
jgi:hypothetical protein